MSNEGNKPVFERTLGQVRIAIWEQVGETGKPWHNVRLTRRFKQGDQWKETPTFNGSADLALVSECVQMAKCWIEKRQP